MLQHSASKQIIFVSASLLRCAVPVATSSIPEERDPRGSWLLFYLWEVWQEFSFTSSKAAERTQSDSTRKSGVLSSRSIKLHQYQWYREQMKEYFFIYHDRVVNDSYRQDALNILFKIHFSTLRFTAFVESLEANIGVANAGVGKDWPTWRHLIHLWIIFTGPKGNLQK